MCDEFYYRTKESDEEIFNKFNTSQENVLRNKAKLKIYAGEWIKIKVNDDFIHHVKPIETIEQVANHYNITVEQIIKDNDLTSEKLFIGQPLKICRKKPL